jgi:hypothetical protein
MSKYERKFYIQLSSGDKFEISELDFNNVKGRVASGKTNGWYTQRGETCNNSRHDWQISFKDIASVFSNKPELKDRTIKNPESIDINKRKPEEVGKPEEKKDDKCSHDWNKPSDWTYVTQVVGGVNRYYKQCISCNAKSTLIKKREVELAQEAIGETLDTIPLVG